MRPPETRFGIQRVTPGPNQESVWDYPRPPQLVLSGRSVRVRFANQTIAETTRAYRVLETSHPPSWYLPPEDVDSQWLVPVKGRQSFCEWKGAACYWSVRVGSELAENAAWSYPKPSASFLPITGYFAFYPGLVDCWVDGERVQPQPGGFYGGWITSDVVGPFKGIPGSMGW